MKNTIKNIKNPPAKKNPGPSKDNLTVYNLIMRDVIQKEIKTLRKEGLLGDYKETLSGLIYKYWTGPKIGFYAHVLSKITDETIKKNSSLWGYLRKMLRDSSRAIDKLGYKPGAHDTIYRLTDTIYPNDLQTLFPYEFSDVNYEIELIDGDSPVEKALLSEFKELNRKKYKLEQIQTISD
jgi:hypothetical protein